MAMDSSNWWDNLPGSTPVTLGSDPLWESNGQQVSNIGSLASGGSSGSGLSAGSALPWGKVIAGGAGLVSSLFAGNSGSLTPAITEIQQGARKQQQQGATQFGEGQAALAPALKYFEALQSGNPADALAATLPQRSRVIDQYDAARRSAGQFTPRGGGQASGQQQAGAKEAEQLAGVTAGARSDASTALASIGQNLESSGVSQEENAQAQLAQVLGPLFQQQQSDSKGIASFFSGLGSLIAPLILA